MATPAQIKWVQIIHIAKKELALSDEQYHAILMGAIGSESSKDIKNWEQYNAVIAAFKTLGFRPKRAGAKPSAACTVRNSDHISYRQEYYIRGLWKLASRKKDERSLRAIVKRIGGVNDITFLSRKDAAKVIQALRDITQKAGFNPDGPNKGES